MPETFPRRQPARNPTPGHGLPPLGYARINDPDCRMPHDRANPTYGTPIPVPHSHPRAYPGGTPIFVVIPAKAGTHVGLLWVPACAGMTLLSGRIAALSASRGGRQVTNFILRCERSEPRMMRLDPDVIAWFKAQGPGHLTPMNEVLRA